MAHYPAIATYVRRRADPDDIADVIAETFTTAWRRLDDVPQRAEHETRLWLYGVARRVLANHFRAEERRTALAARLRDEAATWDVPGREHDPAYQAFQRLSNDDKELLAPVAWEGLSGPEIAKVLGNLMHQITATQQAAPAKPRRRINLRMAVPAGALLATGAVAATTWLLPVSPAAALSIEQEGGYYVIEVKDLYANPKVYEQELRKVGLDVTLEVKPGTASFERLIHPQSPDHRHLTEIKSIFPPGPCDKLGGCATGFKIPKDFSGTANISIFRKARPGEKYRSITTFTAKGEPMHCVPHLDRSVTEVLGLLKQRGVRIAKYVDVTGGSARSASVPGDWHVLGGYLTEPGVATLSVSEDPMPKEDITRQNDKSLRAYGCPIA